MGKPTSQTLKPLPTYCLRALISCGTSDGSLNAKSITSPLRKNQTDRILNIDKQCRALRSKAMKKRHKITQEILAKMSSIRGQEQISIVVGMERHLNFIY